MEYSFSELRAKEVINTQDGRKLGKICDVILCYPENRWIGFVVPNGRGFGFKKQELFLELKNIVKIGEDVILVNIGVPRRSDGDRRGHGSRVSHTQGGGGRKEEGRRSYEEFE